jgi:putative Holliday junction resolvase
MRFLGVDFGEKRVGLAVSGESGTIVVPVGQLARKNDAQVAEEISRAAHEREVSRIVLGHPLRLDGTEGPSGVRTRLFARRLAEVSGLPVDLHGEGLTTVAADEQLVEAGVRASRKGHFRDAEAAPILLRDYLSSPARPAEE